MQQGVGEVVEGALTALAPLPCAPGALGVRAPLANVGALAARPVERTIFSPERPDVGWALFSVAEVVDRGKHRHG